MMEDENNVVYLNTMENEWRLYKKEWPEIFFEIETNPLKMSIMLCENKNEYPLISVKAFIGKGMGNHIHHFSKQIKNHDKEQVIKIFNLFCESYQNSFKKLSFQIFNIEDINCILDMVIQTFEFNRKFGIE